MPPTSRQGPEQTPQRNIISPVYQQGASSVIQSRTGSRQDAGQGVPRRLIGTIYPNPVTRISASALPLSSRYKPPRSPIGTSPDGPSNSSTLLTALATTATSTANAAAYHTSEWTKSIPFLSGQQLPRPATSSSSASPPDPPLTNSRQKATVEGPAFRSAARNRPLSHPAGKYVDERADLERNRRSSMYSNQSRAAYGSSPPLPHHPQAHFRTAPDFGLGQLGQDGRVPGADGYFCGFDSLENGGDGCDNLLIEGYEGGLQVLKVTKEKLDVIGSLENLRGAVIGAKLLPRRLRDTVFEESRPLVAVILHGPVTARARENSLQSDTSDSDDAAAYSESTDSTSSVASLSTQAQSRQLTQYRTTVEVYSLVDGAQICTLYAGPAIPLTENVRTAHFAPPPPVGGLTVTANDRFVFVASAQSGEVFIFAAVPPDDDEQEQAEFQFFGKIWTAVQKGPVTSGSNENAATPEEVEEPRATALLSVGERWLAYVPPLPSATITLSGHVKVPYRQRKPFGLSSHTAPAQPSVSCATLSPDTESFLNRVAREATQELIKGAKWVGGQSLQLWKTYWNKPSDSGMTEQSALHDFPPTHAYSNQQSSATNSLALVAIIDLQSLLNASESLPPKILATFQVPLGCSFLSFAPTGLALLTASRKGDVQYVWDLMRIFHGKTPTTSGPLTALTSSPSLNTSGPHIRQTARFTRMTVARIVDIAWVDPAGERFAMVTDRGTVHLLSLPARAYQWPPPRQVAKAPAAEVVPTQATQSPQTLAEGATGAVSAAVKMVNERAQPYWAAARRRRRSSGTSLAGIAGLGMHSTSDGSRAATSDFGLSRSAGKSTPGAKKGSSRVQLSSTVAMIVPGCVRWLTGRETGLLATVSGGQLQLFETSRSSRQKSSANGFVEFRLPLLSNDIVAPAALRKDVQSAGRWDVGPIALSPPHPSSHFLSMAEIETSVPYQPFHTDRRIGLHVYADRMPESSFDSQYLRYDTWGFGETIPSIRLNLGSALPHDSAILGDRPEQNSAMENVVSIGADEEVEQIVITTRRRKRNGKASAEDEFFDDDDLEIVDFASDRV